MRTFRANEELEKILLNQGFIETTSVRDKEKGKKSFKLSQKSYKEIYFNYANIEIIYRNFVHDSHTDFTEDELKLVLLFFKLCTQEITELLTLSDTFKIEHAKERFDEMKMELAKLKRFDFHKPRKKKIQRIIEAYNAIELDKNKASEKKII